MTIVQARVDRSDGTPEEEWKWAVDSLKECYDWGKKEGVVLAVEAINRFETYFCYHSAQALALAEAVGPDCGVCMDAFHMNMEEADPYESVIKAKGRLVDFHVADTNRFACGQGHWDWLKLVGTLKTIGYDGALTVEFVAPVDRSPANKYPEAIEKNPVDISPEQKKFIEDHGSSLLTEEFYSWQVKTCADVALTNNHTGSTQGFRSIYLTLPCPTSPDSRKMGKNVVIIGTLDTRTGNRLPARPAASLGLDDHRGRSGIPASRSASS
jgi:hypothetical protein